MPINQAARRLARAFRIAFGAARILATDRELPRLLRILFVIGCIQIPCLPTDEIAMAIALGWLFLFHRDRLVSAMREARTSLDAKEHTMSRRKFALAAAAVLTAVAAVVSIALGAVPAFAAVAHRSPLVAVVRYTPQQPVCHKAGERGLIVGDGGHSFAVRCDSDGGMLVWDAVAVTGTAAGDARVCHAVRVFNAAGLPSWRQADAIARGALTAEAAYRDAAGRLLAALISRSHRPFGSQDRAVTAMCAGQQQSGSLVAAFVTGATVGIDHATYAAEPVSARHDRSGYPLPDRAVCAAQSPRPGHVPPAFEIGATGLTWQYVTKREAAYFHVSRCSVVVVAVNRYGQDADLILTPSGRVTGRS